MRRVCSHRALLDLRWLCQSRAKSHKVRPFHEAVPIARADVGNPIPLITSHNVAIGHSLVRALTKGVCFKFEHLSVSYRALQCQRSLRSLQGRHQSLQSLDHAHRPPSSPAPAYILGWQGRPMMHGVIIKLVRSYGSRWGRIQPVGTSREVFFNLASLPNGADFDELRHGQVVEFDEESDRATGSHAVRMVCGALPSILEPR